ncbi:ANTAR domain-containing protein [Nocardioides sp. zg-ZUI104]|nr:ANTAR domain-containing protein [Nocardioides faecalis]
MGPEPPVAQLPLSASAGQTGRFVFHVAKDVWEWDDDVYVIHGYVPGEVEPTSDLIMSHKHEQDRELVEVTLSRARSTGEPFNIYYRIVVGDEIRRVVLVGEGEYDDPQPESTGADAKPRGADRLVGYYLDLTPEMEAESSAAADAAVAASAKARDTIEQAKGILMLGYGLDADAAFAMLKWWSRNRNVKVREVADRLIQVAREGHVSHPGLRRLLDGLLDDLTSRQVT